MEFANKSEVGCRGAAENSLTRQACANSKRLHGQFFTTTNPFVNEAFVRWFKSIKTSLCREDFEILEPFAGSNNIIWMIREIGFNANPWISFDIAPPDENTVEDVPVTKRDVLSDFPSGHRVAITNPPYLAKNIASVNNMDYVGGEYEDVYQKCLAVMLDNCDYVAAIIPETFIKQQLFHTRLSAVVSLTCRMFEDTEHPVCLALFIPAHLKSAAADFEIWQGNRLAGTYEQLRQHIQPPPRTWPFQFNAPNGQIGLRAFDGTAGDSIMFVAGDEIQSDKVKSSSRHNTRIAIDGLSATQVKKLINEANKLLKTRRKETNDVFMTAHRGLRDDGRYRRRLDYSQARDLLNQACCNLNFKSAESTKGA